MFVAVVVALAVTGMAGVLGFLGNQAQSYGVGRLLIFSQQQLEDRRENHNFPPLLYSAEL